MSRAKACYLSAREARAWPKRAPTGPQDGPNRENWSYRFEPSAPRSPPRPPTVPQEAPKGPQDAPNKAPKRPPRGPQEAPGGP